MRTTLISAFAVLTLAGSSAAFAQKTYTLKMKPKVGASYKYVSDMTSKAGPANQKINMVMTLKAKKSTGGKTTMASTINSVKFNGHDMTKDVPGGGKPTDIVFDQNGNVVGGAGGPNAGFSGATYPAKPVAVGATWTSNFAVRGQKVQAKYKLVEVKPLNGVPAARLQATLPSNFPMKLTGPLEMWVELSTGMLLKMNMSGYMSQNGQTATLVMSMRRA